MLTVIENVISNDEVRAFRAALKDAAWKDGAQGAGTRNPESGLTIRSDLSATQFLSSPEEFHGGELLIEGQCGGQAVKLAAGDMVLYPSSSLHQVTPVADDAAPAMLFDLDQSIQALSVGRAADDPDIDRLIHVYRNLMRRRAVV